MNNEVKLKTPNIRASKRAKVSYLKLKSQRKNKWSYFRTFNEYDLIFCRDSINLARNWLHNKLKYWSPSELEQADIEEDNDSEEEYVNMSINKAHQDLNYDLWEVLNQ